MTLRRYAALGLIPLTTGGAQCSWVCGTGRDCGRWAAWADTRAAGDPAPRCNQHAQKTAHERSRDPQFAPALAQASNPVLLAVLVTGTTWSLTEGSTVLAGGPIGADGNASGLERAVRDATS